MLDNRRKRLVVVNTLTLLRLPLGILLAISYSSQPLKWCVALLIAILVISDNLDGLLARKFNVATRIGAILDYTIDRFNFYIVITLLIHSGISVLVFVPFFLRDLVYIAAQVYVSLPRIRGTKAASVAGGVGAYLYILLVNYWNIRTFGLDMIVFALNCLALANLGLRVFRLRTELVTALAADLNIP